VKEEWVYLHAYDSVHEDRELIMAYLNEYNCIAPTPQVKKTPDEAYAVKRSTVEQGTENNRNHLFFYM
jgi:hypothetical protein